MFRAEEFVFVGHSADDHRRDAVVLVAEVNAGFVSRVHGLTKLLWQRQVAAHQHVEVIPLCHLVLHDSTTNQKINTWRFGWESNPLMGF